MPDFSLVPVDYQPDFGNVSLVPVDYDPFADNGAAQPAPAEFVEAKQAPAQAALTQASVQIQPAQPQPRVTPTPIQSRSDCHSRCADLALPTKDYGIQFQRCVLACMSNGSSGLPRWDRYF